MPYYDIRHSADVREEIQKRIPFIDARYANHSYVDGQLYDVMKGCYRMHPDERISMEEAIHQIREAERVYKLDPSNHHESRKQE